MPQALASTASAYRTATSTAFSNGPALPSRFGLAAGRVEDLLEDVRHREEERRLERGQVGQQGGRVQLRLVAEADPAADRRDLHHPPEDVRQRQEQQGRRLVARLGVEDGLPACR
jgi:hypothetical protein